MTGKQITDRGLPFTKMSGSGNDFIFMDGMDGSLAWIEGEWVRRVCRRALSVGADGLVILEKDESYDFAWRFFNSDGSMAEMCGNAGRCVARFAFEKGITGSSMTFLTEAGPIHAEVKGKRAKVQLTPPKLFDPDLMLQVNDRRLPLFYIDTGVPHVVFEVEELETFPLVEIGRKIRYHEHFGPAGTNVNIVKVVDTHTLQVRTYERGVEDETLACGTGSMACGLMAGMKKGIVSPVSIKTASGEVLEVSWEGEPGSWAPVYIEGGVRLVYEGYLAPDASKA